MESFGPPIPVAPGRPGEAFPPVPASWFHFCASHELDRGPVGIELAGSSFAGYRTTSGRAVVLGGRCSHLGARLANGTISGECLVCPLHGWEYRPDGRCEKIPGTETIPDFARQRAFPVEERGGDIFFFNRPRAHFPLPFFEGVDPNELLPAKPFELIAEAPWYFVGANGFDLGHFRMAHDRTLIGIPVVSSPSPYARRIVASFEVTGKSPADRLTSRIAGPRVTMDVTSWLGTIILVRATFARTTTFGIFNVLPLDHTRTLGRVIVWVRRGRYAPARALFDPLNAAVRRLFIRRFLSSDLPAIAGARYQPANLIAPDAVLAEYFMWLEKACTPPPTENL